MYESECATRNCTIFHAFGKETTSLARVLQYVYPPPEHSHIYMYIDMCVLKYIYIMWHTYAYFNELDVEILIVGISVLRVRKREKWGGYHLK